MRCLVSGRVQGVFFRDSTRQFARGLGLSGYARNLADGRVEVLACGAPSKLAKLREWLTQGPPQAQVEKLHCERQPSQAMSGFRIE